MYCMPHGFERFISFREPLRRSLVQDGSKLWLVEAQPVPEQITHQGVVPEPTMPGPQTDHEPVPRLQGLQLALAAGCVAQDVSKLGAYPVDHRSSQEERLP